MLSTISPSTISWIGSLQIFLPLFVGIFAGWALDIGYLRSVLFAGSFLIVFGLFMTSLCTEYWQFILAQGLCVGLGSGALAFTSTAVIPYYFLYKRMFAAGIAAGIAATGSSIGEFIIMSIYIILTKTFCSRNCLSYLDTTTYY